MDRPFMLAVSAHGGPWMAGLALSLTVACAGGAPLSSSSPRQAVTDDESEPAGESLTPKHTGGQSDDDYDDGDSSDDEVSFDDFGSDTDSVDDDSASDDSDDDDGGDDGAGDDDGGDYEDSFEADDSGDDWD